MTLTVGQWTTAVKISRVSKPTDTRHAFGCDEFHLHQTVKKTGEKLYYQSVGIIVWVTKNEFYDPSVHQTCYTTMQYHHTVSRWEQRPKFENLNDLRGLIS